MSANIKYNPSKVQILGGCITNKRLKLGKINRYLISSDGMQSCFTFIGHDPDRVSCVVVRRLLLESFRHTKGNMGLLISIAIVALIGWMLNSMMGGK